MKLKPKLLVLTSSFPRWPGDQTCGYVRQLALALSARYEVTVLTPACAGAPEREECEGIRVVRFHYFFPRRYEVLESSTDSWQTLKQRLLARGVLPFYLAAFFWQALRWGRGADALLSHWLVPSGLIAASLARWLKKPHLVVEHSGGLRLLYRLPAGRQVARFVLQGSRQVVTVSQELRRRLIELVPDAGDKTSVIPMGVETRGVVPAQAGPSQRLDPSQGNGHRIVLYLGRLTEVKGVRYLIEAMSGMDQAMLVIAGSGECEERLKELAARTNVCALFLGPVDEQQKRIWLARCHLVVIPSLVLANGKTEGVPVVCLEALAAGKPVIASRVGGLPEVIRHGENGFLVEPANILDLRGTLARLIRDEALRRAVGEQARLTAQQYDWQVIGRRFTCVMEAVAGGSQASHCVEHHL